jgi:hypothetical protein
MKKILFLLILLFLNFVCFAVDDTTGKWAFGIKAGTDYPLTESSLKTYTFFTGGFTAEHYYNDYFSVQFELNYFAVSTTDTFKSWDVLGNALPDETINSKFHFLQIPVLAMIALPLDTQKDLSLFFDLGPVMDWLLGISSNNQNMWSTKHQRIGVITGAGVNYQLNNGSKITLEIRGEWILHAFDTGTYVDDGYIYIDPYASVYTASIISTMVGYTF